MQLCYEHAKNITRIRIDLGLQEAKLRLEFRGIDLDVHRLDGYVCPICEHRAEFSAAADSDGHFLVCVWTNPDLPPSIY